MLVHVQRQIGMIEMQEEIKSQVQEELGERQREMYLREQMKAIQKELGDDDQRKEIVELREKLDKLELPEGSARRRSSASSDASSAPAASRWRRRSSAPTSSGSPSCRGTTRSDDNLDLTRAQTVLDEDHYGLPDVKDRVLEFLAVRQLRAQEMANEVEQTGEMSDRASSRRIEGRRDAAARRHGRRRRPVTDKKEAKARAMAKGPILLFVGPPGVGKTSIAKSIARSLGREYVRVALGGVRDEADIRGHRRTYVGAMPGRIIQGLKQAKTRNPVFLLDEVDKLGMSFQGDPASALLEVLDPAQNDTFTDHYLGIPFDLSEVLFIATANFIQNIPGPLLDRMEVVEFAGYTEREKAEIAKKYLIPRQLEESGLESKNVVFTDDAVMSIVIASTRARAACASSSGRSARWRARSRASSPSARHGRLSTIIDAEDVRELLGRPRVHPEHANEENEVGVATGMYYTPMGGDIMFVEAAIRRLHGAQRATTATTRRCR